MTSCVYCLYEAIENGMCPKCGNPVPESRTVLVGDVGINLPLKSASKAIPSQVPLDRGVRRAIQGGRKRYPVFVWAAIGFLIIAGSILRVIGVDEKGNTTSANSSDSRHIDSDGKSLPVFVGKNVNTVRDFADNSLLYLSFYDTSGSGMEQTLGPKHGNGRGSWMDLLSTYYVCEQLPLPGVPLSAGSNKVALNVSEKCEGAPVNRVSDAYKRVYGLWGPAAPKSDSASNGKTFEGWVVEVVPTGLFDGLRVKILTPFSMHTIELAGLSQADSPCPTKHSNSQVWDLAFKEVQARLPKGAPVTFTYIGPRPAVISTLKVDDALQVASANLPSVNEALVANGYWVPDAADLSTSSVLDRGAKWKLWYPDDASSYDKTLVDLANKAIKTGAGPMVVCKK